MAAPLLLLCIFLALFVPGQGIIRHPNIPDDKYITDVSNYPFFVALGELGSCAGSVIAGSTDKNYIYIATAAHCFCADGEKTKADTEVLFAGDKKGDGLKVQASDVKFNPKCMFSCENDGPNKCDTALMKLPADQVPKNARLAALKVYQWSDEKGKEIRTFGYGTTGNAKDLSTEDKCADAEPDGKFRMGQNVVTGVKQGIIEYKMDCESASVVEALSAAGDSGGPALIKRNGIYYLAGVNSGNGEENQCDCDTVDQYNRLSDYYTSFIAPTLGISNTAAGTTAAAAGTTAAAAAYTTAAAGTTAAAAGTTAAAAGTTAAAAYTTAAAGTTAAAAYTTAAAGTTKANPHSPDGGLRIASQNAAIELGDVKLVRSGFGKLRIEGDVEVGGVLHVQDLQVGSTGIEEYLKRIVEREIEENKR